MAPTKNVSAKKAATKKAPTNPTTKLSNKKILTARKVSSLKAPSSRAVSSHGSSPPPSVSEGPSRGPSRRAFVTDEEDDTVMVESDESGEGDITMEAPAKEAEEHDEEPDEELSKLACFTNILAVINLLV
jgi:hypothetical protein